MTKEQRNRLIYLAMLVEGGQGTNDVITEIMSILPDDVTVSDITALLNN